MSNQGWKQRGNDLASQAECPSSQMIYVQKPRSSSPLRPRLLFGPRFAGTQLWWGLLLHSSSCAFFTEAGCVTFQASVPKVSAKIRHILFFCFCSVGCFVVFGTRVLMNWRWRLSCCSRDPQKFHPLFVRRWQRLRWLTARVILIEVELSRVGKHIYFN